MTFSFNGYTSLYLHYMREEYLFSGSQMFYENIYEPKSRMIRVYSIDMAI